MPDLSPEIFPGCLTLLDLEMLYPVVEKQIEKQKWDTCQNKIPNGGDAEDLEDYFSELFHGYTE